MVVLVEEPGSSCFHCWRKAMAARFLRRIKLATQVLFSGNVTAGKREAIPAITEEEVTEAKLFFPMEKFFIFGHARSGTTLLARLVRIHPEVHCNYQAHFFTRPPLLQDLVSDLEVGKWLTRSSNRWNRGRDLSPVVMRSVSDFILERDARQVGKSIVGDKSPNSLLNGESVRLLFNIYPDASLVFIVRDGRDAVLSHRFQSFIDNPQHLSKEDEHIFESFIQNPQPFLDGDRSLFTHTGITRAAEGWVHNVVETDYWGGELFGERFFTLMFEDLLEHPWDELDRLWSFLGVKTDIAGLDEDVKDELTRNPDADWQQYKAGEIAQVIQKGKHGSWRELFTKRDIQIFEGIAGDTQLKWGYESSKHQAAD
jgi:hypothetical protein